MKPLENEMFPDLAVVMTLPVLERTDGSNNLYRQTGITYPSGVSQEIHYGASGSIDDAFNRADRLKVAGEATDLVAYEFAGVGRVVTLDYPGTNAKLSYLKPANFVGTGDSGDNMTGYDRFGRTVAMPWAKRSDGTPLADVGYGYDRMSRRTFRGDATPAANGEFDQYFAYDPLGQIKERSRGTLNGSRNAVGGIPEENESWRYDEQGNWLGYDLNEDGNTVIQQTRTHNPSNQIVSIDGSGAGTAYDANGNMTQIPTGRDLEGVPNQVTWDAWNRITEVRDDAGALVAEYRYDALYRRVTRQLPGEGLRHTYYNQKWRPVEERQGTGTDSTKLWWWGDRHRDDLARRDRDTNGNGTLDESLWCLMDYFDPTAVVDSSGDVQERYSYSAFGMSRVAGADYTERASSAFAWEFRFHGQFEDVETGWMDYGYRYYLPELGRWPSRDPIGESGGANSFTYLDNAIVNQNDFLGLKGDQKECDRIAEAITKVKDRIDEIEQQKTKNNEAIRMWRKKIEEINDSGYGADYANSRARDELVTGGTVASMLGGGVATVLGRVPHPAVSGAGKVVGEVSYATGLATAALAATTPSVKDFENENLDSTRRIKQARDAYEAMTASLQQANKMADLQIAQLKESIEAYCESWSQASCCGACPK